MSMNIEKIVRFEFRTLEEGDIYYNDHYNKWMRSLGKTTQKAWVAVLGDPPSAPRRENLTFFEAVAILKSDGGKIYCKNSPPDSFITISAHGNNLLLRDRDNVIASCDNLLRDGWIWEPRE